MPAPILFTPRLKLRHWEKKDWPIFAQMNASLKVMEFFPNTLNKKESDSLALAIIRELMNKPYGLWALALRKSDQFIGFLGLHEQTFKAPFTPCIEIGWRLREQSWGQGYASEAGRRVIQYAFDVLKLQEIVSMTSNKNKKSILLMKRLAMTTDRDDDFLHPKLDETSPLKPHVLYRIRNQKS